jgi:hypothetical protein
VSCLLVLLIAEQQQLQLFVVFLNLLELFVIGIVDAAGLVDVAGVVDVYG